jgi:hypothetical protein
MTDEWTQMKRPPGSNGVNLSAFWDDAPTGQELIYPRPRAALTLALG